MNFYKHQELKRIKNFRLDLSFLDLKAMHLFVPEDREVVACLRVFLKDDGNATIGRVVTARKVRGTGLGKQTMMEGIKTSKSLFGRMPIIIHAQCQARSFFEKCGFVVSSEEFLEDGIPHVEMTYSF